MFAFIEVKQYYDDWSKTYDLDLSELKYNFPEIVAKKAVSLTTQEQREKWSFLDLGTGKPLSKCGFLLFLSLVFTWDQNLKYLFSAWPIA